MGIGEPRGIRGEWGGNLGTQYQLWMLGQLAGTAAFLGTENAADHALQTLQKPRASQRPARAGVLAQLSELRCGQRTILSIPVLCPRIRETRTYLRVL